jgi:type II secretory pathway pseudopilin PulG
MKKINIKKAFTIIEVVLVLGIAGLIMLAIFIAIPAMERSKRNQIRKDDLSRIMRAIMSYESNHSGKPPIYYEPSATGHNGLSCNGGIGADDVKNNKSCFLLRENFVEKYIEENAVLDEVWQWGGWNYKFKCKDGEYCGNFKDPDNIMYTIKTEGLGYVDGGEEIGGVFNEIIHLSAYSRCASAGVSTTKALHMTTRTNDDSDVAIVYVLEPKNVYYCVDNQ